MARPQIELDAELVRELCRAQLTNDEIAVCCKCSPDTLTRRFAEQLKEWKSEGVSSVRRELFKTATDNRASGKTAAMIFFLKNYGGMSDNVNVNQKVTVSHEDG